MEQDGGPGNSQPEQDADSATQPVSSCSQRSMAETLVEFTRPLFAQADEQTTREQLLEVLKLAVTIWNALVVDQWGQGTNHLAELRAVVRAPDAPPELGTVFEQLVRCKRELFADDLRAVGEFDVVQEGSGSFTVRAEARLPPRLQRPAR